MKALTPRQKEAFEFIRGFMAEKEFAPSYDEIMQALGLRSKSGVHNLLKSLQFRGLVRIHPNLKRGIEIPRPEKAEYHLTRVLRAIDGLPVSDHAAVKNAARFLAGA